MWHVTYAVMRVRPMLDGGRSVGHSRRRGPQLGVRRAQIAPSAPPPAHPFPPPASPPPARCNATRLKNDIAGRYHIYVTMFRQIVGRSKTDVNIHERRPSIGRRKK